MRNAMDAQEVAVGWWPGDPRSGKAAFYAYAHPAPEGFADATLSPPPRTGMRRSASTSSTGTMSVRAPTRMRAGLEFAHSAFGHACAVCDWDPALARQRRGNATADRIRGTALRCRSHADVAQLVEHRSCKQEVTRGLSPATGGVCRAAAETLQQRCSRSEHSAGRFRGLWSAPTGLPDASGRGKSHLGSTIRHGPHPSRPCTQDQRGRQRAQRLRAHTAPLHSLRADRLSPPTGWALPNPARGDRRVLERALPRAAARPRPTCSARAPPAIEHGSHRASGHVRAACPTVRPAEADRLRDPARRRRKRALAPELTARRK